MAVAAPPAERAAGRRSALKRGLALPPASPGAAPGFPVTDADHWDKAFQSVGRAGSPGRRAALGKLLRKTAGQFGKASRVKGSWLDKGGSKHAGDSSGIDLVGPKGYDHGWKYVGGPGLPKTPGGIGRQASTSHRTHLPKSSLAGYKTTTAHQLRAGDRIAFGSKGELQEHKVISVQHHVTGSGQHRTQVHLRRPDGSTHRISISSKSVVTRRMDTGSAAPAPSGPKHLSNPLETAMTDRKLPVSGLSDIIVSRIRGGGAVIRHRNGGGEIAQLNRSEDGWVVTIDGQAMPARGHQRAALAQAIGLHNRAAGTPFHRATQPAATDPLQGAPEQTDLMKQYGIPAIRALATPADSAGDGPRMTASSASDSTGNGLGPRGKQIYAKLKAKGFPDARAMAFAKRAEAMIARKSGKLWPPRS
jgi:hypothetical protein